MKQGLFEALVTEYGLLAAACGLDKAAGHKQFILDAFAARGWQPIESAPKDGTLIIVPGGVARWGDECWLSVTGCRWPGSPITWEVSYWMAIDGPPMEEEK